MLQQKMDNHNWIPKLDIKGEEEVTTTKNNQIYI